MATPVVTPIAGTEPNLGETRWQLHATSLSETLAQLSRIWGGFARDSAAIDGPNELATSILEDPLLSSRAALPGDLRVRTRTSVLTLVVVAPTPETQQRALATVGCPRLAASLAGRDPGTRGPRRTQPLRGQHLCRLPGPGTHDVRGMHRGDPAAGRRGARPASREHRRAAAHPRPAGGPLVARRRALRERRAAGAGRLVRPAVRRLQQLPGHGRGADGGHGPPAAGALRRPRHRLDAAGALARAVRGPVRPSPATTRAAHHQWAAHRHRSPGQRHPPEPGGTVRGLARRDARLAGRDAAHGRR